MHLVGADGAVGVVAADVEEVLAPVHLAEFQLGVRVVHQADGHVLVGPFGGPVVLVGHDGGDEDRAAVGRGDGAVGGVVANAVGLQDRAVADHGRIVRLHDVPGRRAGHDVGLDRPAEARTGGGQAPGPAPQVAAGLVGEAARAQGDVGVRERFRVDVRRIPRRSQPVDDQAVRIIGVRQDAEDAVVVRRVGRDHVLAEAGRRALVDHRRRIGPDGDHVARGVGVRVGARIGQDRADGRMQHDDGVGRAVRGNLGPDHFAAVQGERGRRIRDRGPVADGRRIAPGAGAFAGAVGGQHPIVVVPARNGRHVVERQRAGGDRADAFGGVGVVVQVAPNAVARFTGDVAPGDRHVVRGRALRSVHVRHRAQPAVAGVRNARIALAVLVGSADPVVVPLARSRRLVEPVRDAHGIGADAVRAAEDVARAPVQVIGRFGVHVAPLQRDVVGAGAVRRRDHRGIFRHVGRGDDRLVLRIAARAAAGAFRAHAVVVGHVLGQAGHDLARAGHRQVVESRHVLRLDEIAPHLDVVDRPDFGRGIVRDVDLQGQGGGRIGHGDAHERVVVVEGAADLGRRHADRRARDGFHDAGGAEAPPGVAGACCTGQGDVRHRPERGAVEGDVDLDLVAAFRAVVGVGGDAGHVDFHRAGGIAPDGGLGQDQFRLAADALPGIAAGADAGRGRQIAGQIGRRHVGVAHRDAPVVAGSFEALVQEIFRGAGGPAGEIRAFADVQPVARSAFHRFPVGEEAARRHVGGFQDHRRRRRRRDVVVQQGRRIAPVVVGIHRVIVVRAAHQAGVDVGQFVAHVGHLAAGEVGFARGRRARGVREDAARVVDDHHALAGAVQLEFQRHVRGIERRHVEVVGGLDRRPEVQVEIVAGLVVGHAEGAVVGRRLEPGGVDPEAVFVEVPNRRAVHDLPGLVDAGVEVGAGAGEFDREVAAVVHVERAGRGQQIPVGSGRADGIGHVHSQNAAVRQGDFAGGQLSGRRGAAARIHGAVDGQGADGAGAAQGGAGRDRVGRSGRGAVRDERAFGDRRGAQIGVDRRHGHRARGRLDQPAVGDRAAQRDQIADRHRAQVAFEIDRVRERQRAGIGAPGAQRHRALDPHRLGHRAALGVAGGHHRAVLQDQLAAAVGEIFHQAQRAAGHDDGARERRPPQEQVARARFVERAVAGGLRAGHLAGLHREPEVVGDVEREAAGRQVAVGVERADRGGDRRVGAQGDVAAPLAQTGRNLAQGAAAVGAGAGEHGGDRPPAEGAVEFQGGVRAHGDAAGAHRVRAGNQLHGAPIDEEAAAEGVVGGQDQRARAGLAQRLRA